MEAGTQMGPLVSEEQLRRVSGYLESGKAEGATAVVVVAVFGDRGYFIEPTVLINTHGNMKVVREEIFGPVLVAAPFSDLDEIAAQANDSEYGQGAGIWTKDISKAHALAKKLKAGPSGSTATTSSTRRCRSAATSNPAGAARWATRSSRPTPRSRPSPRCCNGAGRGGGQAAAAWPPPGQSGCRGRARPSYRSPVATSAPPTRAATMPPAASVRPSPRRPCPA